MSWTLLLYGASGFSGRLIAKELAGTGIRLVLAGRSPERLQPLAAALGVSCTAFALEELATVKEAIAASGAQVVLNAAGPFSQTAPMLAAAAIELRCHYLDINGEADVYATLLDRLHDRARTAGVALVGGAGFWPAASNVLLHCALAVLAKGAQPPGLDLGAVRIAMSRIDTFSRGSAGTVWRMLRSHVTVVRRRRAAPRDRLQLSHEPVGRLERTFDFGRRPGVHDTRIATAASLVDTLAARLAMLRAGSLADSIESYVEAGQARRIALQFGATFAPLLALPRVQALLRQPLGMLAEGPEQQERRGAPHIVLLQIEDAFRTTVIDWRWQTPNVYDFSATLAAEIALRLPASGLKGWTTASEVLQPTLQDLDTRVHPFGGCALVRRGP